jgi:predicted TIM-barrel fold metal-dependent hydrolase
VKIDAFSHVRPQRYADAVERLVEAEVGLGGLGGGAQPGAPQEWMKPLVDAGQRVRFLDEAEVDKQIITHTVPPIEQATHDSNIGAQLAIASNNAVRDMADEYSDRFLPIGTVAMNDMDAACKEAERCLKTLGMKGILIYTNANGKFLNDPALDPFFDYMNKQDKPIWIHPYFNPSRPDPKPDIQGINIAQVFGWPFDTVVAMTCLIYGGVLDRHPNLKFITHHAGAGIPFFEQRLATHGGSAPQLRRPMLDYYRSFYVDSAIQGSIGGMRASYAFYGASQILLGTDMPYASPNGDGNTKQCVASIQALDVPPAEKEAMFSGNLLRLIGEA